MNGRISKEARKNRLLREQRKLKRKLEVEASEVEKVQKSVAPSVKVPKNRQEVEEKRIQIQQEHRQPRPSRLLEKSQEVGKPAPESEIPSCVINACIRCPLYGYQELQEIEEGALLICPICQTVSRIPETDRAAAPDAWPSWFYEE